MVRCNKLGVQKSFDEIAAQRCTNKPKREYDTRGARQWRGETAITHVVIIGLLLYADVFSEGRGLARLEETPTRTKSVRK